MNQHHLEEQFRASRERSQLRHQEVTNDRSAFVFTCACVVMFALAATFIILLAFAYRG